MWSIASIALLMLGPDMARLSLLEAVDELISPLASASEDVVAAVYIAGRSYGPAGFAPTNEGGADATPKVSDEELEIVFASSVFVPVSSMPDWLRAVAEVSPVTLTADAARTYALDGGVPPALGGAAAWTFGLLLVFVPLCVWRYRRMS